MTDLSPRALILTLYGLYAREEHNWLSVVATVKLMGHFGVEPAGVRSSISRMKRRGTLESMRLSGVAGYALSQNALELIREGDVRIFERRAAEWDGFILAVFSIPERERDKRHALRKSLTALGFGTVSPGVWIAPAAVHHEAVRVLEKRGLSRYVDLFRAKYEEFGSLADRVAQWWDLVEIGRQYDEFLERFSQLSEGRRWSREGAEHAFEVYVPMLTEWRRLPYLDPGLPASLLPRDWSGFRAQALFGDLNALLRTPAREYALSVIYA